MSRCGGKTGSSFLSRKFSPFCFLPPEFSLILPARIHLSLWDAPKSLSLPPHTHTSEHISSNSCVIEGVWCVRTLTLNSFV